LRDSQAGVELTNHELRLPKVFPTRADTFPSLPGRSLPCVKFERQVHLTAEALNFFRTFAKHFCRSVQTIRQRFDIVGQGLLNVAHVAGFEIHGAGAASGGKDGHAALAREEVLPFVGVRVPVQFANTARLDGDDGGCDRGGYLERARVDDAYFAGAGEDVSRVCKTLAEPKSLNACEYRL
jgi:hypothetical protein